MLWMARSVNPRRRAGWTVVILLAAGLVLGFGAWLASGSNTLAAGGSTATVNCADGESSTAHGLQWALNQAQPGVPLTINMDQANCQIPATTSLTIGADVDITINGGGLTIDGGQDQSGYNLFNIEDSTAQPSTLSLNDITLENASSGVYETPIGGSDYAATANLTDCTVNNIYYGVYTAIQVAKHSNFTNNYTALYPYAGTVEDSTFTNNPYPVYVVANNDGSLPGDATVKDSTFTNSSYISGSYAIYAANDAAVGNSTVSGFDYGIYAITATITNSTLADNSYAVDADTANVTGSTVSDSYDIGVYVYFANVSQSTFTSNVEGIQVYAGPTYVGDATVTHSTFTGNDCAVQVWIDSSNTDYSATAEVGESRFDQNGLGIYGSDQGCPVALGAAAQAAATSVPAPGRAPAPAPNLSGKGTTHISSLSSRTVKPADVASTPRTISLTDSLITNSGANGIFTSEIASVTNSTISGSGGDGINAVFANVGNSTITANGIGSGGSGIDASASAAVVFTTITGNEGAGVSLAAGGQATLTATLLSDNSGDNCAAPGGSFAFIDYGGNLSTDGSCGFGAFSSLNTVSRQQLNLGSLSNNGGPLAGAPGSAQVVQTIALGNGSLALNRLSVNTAGQCIDQGGNVIVYPGTSTPVTTDERGVSRPQGAGCDSGAFEANLLAKTAPGTSTVVHRGFYALIRIEALDANGNNISSRTLPVTSVELDGPNGQVIPFDYRFQFGRFGRESGYQLAINTRNLTPGQWTLVVKIGSTYPATLDVPLTVE